MLNCAIFDVDFFSLAFIPTCKLFEVGQILLIDFPSIHMETFEILGKYLGVVMH